MTIDGTDFRIQKPKVFDTKWYSYKFNSSGLRYEVGVCIFSGLVVWVNGPFPCGANPDITIFRSALKDKLLIGERVEADSGYLGEPLYISVPDDYIDDAHRLLKSQARSRQEHLNGRFKMFEILKQIYRHELSMHADVFFSIATLVQLGLIHKDKYVWEVNYAGEIFTGLPLPY